MREKLKVAGAFLIGLSVASSVTFAQLGGRGRNVAFVDGTAISPSSVTTGGVTSTGPISVAAGQNLCLDGPACLTRFNYNSGVNNLDYFQNNAIRLAVTPGGSVQAQLGFNANVAAGGYGYACTNVGCRLHLGSTARYLTDDGTNLEFVAPVQATRVETTNTTPNTPAVTVASDTQVCLDGATCSVNLKYNSGSSRAELTYGGTSTLVVGAAGVRVTNTTLVADTSVDLPALVRLRNTATTIADSGGAGAASHTQSVYNVGVRYTCNDADGCNVTMSEVSAIDGYTMTFTNESANTVNFTDTAGVTELAGNFAMGQYDTLTLRYVNDRWVELSRSNN